MKVSLVFPPQWTQAHPNSALAMLAGELKCSGHQSFIHDFNLEFFDFVTSRRTTRIAWERAKLERSAALCEAKALSASAGPTDEGHMALRKSVVIENYFARMGADTAERRDSWAAAPDKLRSAKSFYNPVELVNAHDAIDQALKLFSISFFPAEVCWNGFIAPTVSEDLPDMMEFCADSLNNPFHTFFEHRLERLLADEAGLIAISIGDRSQVLPGLTLAMMLKHHVKNLRARNPAQRVPHISIGGNYFTRVREELIKTPGFFTTFADSVTTGEGEVSIRILARVVERSNGSPRAMEETRSTLYLDADGVVCATPTAPKMNMDDAAFMDFSGFSMQGYHAPENVVCIRSSKGCYYGKCTFCDVYHGLDENKIQVDRFIEELTHLNKEYGVSHFELIDQCISPDRMRLICDAIERSNLNIRWFCNGRTESGFTKPLLDDMVRAGCTKVMWGVESGSARLLKLMRKGVSPTERMEVLRNASAADLWNFAFVFFGFPTETESEAQETIDFICNNTDIVHAYGRSIFTLGKHSPLMDQLEELGIRRSGDASNELSKDIVVQLENGLQGADLHRVGDLCTEQALKAYGGAPLWMYLRSRETLHLYLAHHGRQFVQQYGIGAQSGTQMSIDEFVF